MRKKIIENLTKKFIQGIITVALEKYNEITSRKCQLKSTKNKISFSKNSYDDFRNRL